MTAVPFGPDVFHALRATHTCAASAGDAAANDAVLSMHAHAELQRACRALWVATLGLMSAFVQSGRSDERRALALRIAGNFALLQRQAPAFAPACHEHFARLARRWGGIAA